MTEGEAKTPDENKDEPFLFRTDFREALDLYFEARGRVDNIQALQQTYGSYGQDAQCFDRTPEKEPPHLSIRANEAMDDMEMFERQFEAAIQSVVEEEVKKRFVARAVEDMRDCVERLIEDELLPEEKRAQFIMDLLRA